jgi:hypothetical protein
MIASALKREPWIVLTALALCAALAGCVSDMGAPTAQNFDGSHLRYYGGPKAMWSGE